MPTRANSSGLMSGSSTASRSSLHTNQCVNGARKGEMGGGFDDWCSRVTACHSRQPAADAAAVCSPNLLRQAANARVVHLARVLLQPECSAAHTVSNAAATIHCPNRNTLPNGCREAHSCR